MGIGNRTFGHRAKVAAEFSNKHRKVTESMRVGQPVELGDGTISAMWTWGNGESWRCAEIVMTRVNDDTAFVAKSFVFNMKGKMTDTFEDRQFENHGELVEFLWGLIGVEINYEMEVNA